MAAGRLVVHLAALCLASSAETARAESVSLSWSAPSECPTQAWIVGEVSRLLGHDLDFGDGTAALRIAAQVTQTAGSYQVILETTTADGVGSRTLVDPSCRQIAEAAALVIALTVDPEAVSLGASPASDDPPPSFAVSLLGASSSGQHWDPTLGMVAAFSTLWLPATAPRARLEGFAGTWSSRRLGPGAGIGARLRTPLAAGARGCAGGAWSRLELSGCLGAELAVLQASAVGVSEPGTGRGLLMGAGGGPMAAWELGGDMWLRVGVDIVRALSRPTFAVQVIDSQSGPSQVLFRPPAFAWRAALGVELHFF